MFAIALTMLNQDMSRTAVVTLAGAARNAISELGARRGYRPADDRAVRVS
jgi:hypothetical protein